MEKEKLQAEIKRARNEYAKVWRAANKDKVKAAQERYWAKKAREQLASAANKQQGDV